MMRWQLVLAVICLAAVTGCKQAATKAPTATTTLELKGWEKRAAEMKAKLRVGMSQEEVSRLLGDPHRTVATMAGAAETVSWSYDLASNVFFRVRFDGKGKVVNFGATSPVPRVGG